MNGNDRRNGIIGILSSAGGEAVTASRLAAEFGVTRQIIVSRTLRYCAQTDSR